MSVAPFEIPEGATLVFDGLAEGDEDFFSQQCGHLNISLAYRELQRIGARPVPCDVPREELAEYRKLRDIDPEHVEHLKALGQDALTRPVLLGELEPGSLTLIDGVHRLMAIAELNPAADMIRLQGYIVPHRCLDLLKIKVYFAFPDGRRIPIDHDQYLRWSWGKFTKPGDSPRG
jgi:hypothetical protein